MITSAIQKTGNFVLLFNETGRSFKSIQGTLVGFTSENVSVRPNKNSKFIFIYNSKGNHTKTIQG